MKRPVTDRKLYIHNEFRRRLGSILNKTRSGRTETFKNGKMTRKLFNNFVVSAEMRVFNKNLIDHCFTISHEFVKRI